MESETSETPKTVGLTNYKKDVWVDYFVAKGYSLFSLNGKTPVKDAKNWQKTPYNPLLEAEDLRRNYGIVLKADDLVIDVDPRNFVQCVNGKLIGANGREWNNGKNTPDEFGLDEGQKDDPLSRLLADAGIVGKLKTFATRTGGGGWHLWLKKPPGFPHRMTLSRYPGLEFKTKGQFLVGPGSVHPDTHKTYTVYREGDAVEAPEPLLAILQRDSYFTDEGLGETDDDEGTQNRFISFLKIAPPAIEYCNGDLTTYKVACYGRDFGLSKTTTFDLMAQYYNPRCVPLWSMEALRAKVENAYSYGQQKQGALHPEIDFKNAQDLMLFTNPEDPLSCLEAEYLRWDVNKVTGKPKPNNLGNICSYFLLPDFEACVNPLYRLVRYNEFADRIEFNFPAPWHPTDSPQLFWTSKDAVQLKHWLGVKQFYDVTTVLCTEAIISLATTMYRYHPIKKYLEDLVWDGVPRLDSWLSEYLGAPQNDYTKAVGKNTLIAAVARVYEPGCKFDHVLVLEGAQGIGKSSLIEKLFGVEFYRDFFIDPHNKDVVDAMKGAWCVEASEMEMVRRSEVQALKSFLARKTDFVRPAYGRSTEVTPRQCIFIGTVNPEKGDPTYLTDNTGNRRFWPVAATKADFNRIAEDRDQIWAEAYLRYSKREEYYLHTQELCQAATNEQAARTVRDPWVDIIQDWMARQLQAGTLPDTTTASYIAQEAMNLSARHIDRVAQTRISNALVELGWERGKFYSHLYGRTVSGFKYDNWL